MLRIDLGGYVLDLCALWLRYLQRGDVGRLQRTSRRAHLALESVALLVDDVRQEPCMDETRHVSFRVISPALPRILYASNFLTKEETRMLMAMGRIASVAMPAVKPLLRARQLRRKHYVETVAENEWTWLPPRTATMLRLIESRIGALTRCRPSRGDGEALELHYTPALDSRLDAPPCSTLDGAMWSCSDAGLHVDVNNGYPHRFVTALCYLNDVPHRRGGSTCFPAAAADKCNALHTAAAHLIGNGVHHTGAALRQEQDEALFDDACTLVSAAARLADLDDAAPVSRLRPGLRLQPIAGSLCLFWSLDDDGRLDPTSIHGGARVLRKATDDSRYFWRHGKWTLQSFVQLPPHLRTDADHRADERAAFVRASRRCGAGGASGMHFVVLDEDEP